MDYWCGECPVYGNDMYCEEDGSNANCHICEGMVRSLNREVGKYYKLSPFWGLEGEG